IRSRWNGSPPARWRRSRTLTSWRGLRAAGTREAERIIEAAEHRRLTAGKPGIPVADDEGTRHAAHPEPYRRVQVREGAAAEGGKHLAGIEERRQLEAHARAEGVEARHARAQLRAASEHVAVHVPIEAVAAQRLALVGHAAVAAEAGERPERSIASGRHVARPHMPGKRDVAPEREVAARLRAGIGVGHRAAGGSAHEAVIDDIAHAAVGDDGRIARVVGEQRRMLQLVLAAEALE